MNRASEMCETSVPNLYGGVSERKKVKRGRKNT